MEKDKNPITIRYDNNDYSYEIAIAYKIVFETTERVGNTAGMRETTTA